MQSAPNATERAGAAPQLTKEDLESWLDGFLPYALQVNDMAGAVVLVVKDGKVFFAKGYGYSDVKAHAPIDPERTIMGVGSVSKTFTWTAVMQLVQEGKIDLDRDVNDYLDFKIPATYSTPITMRNLMTHTAGFEERVKTQHRPGATPRNLAEFMQQVGPPTRIYPPGKVLAYSNYGADLAGYIVQRVSGERFPDYIQHHILAPLGIRYSTFWPVPKELQPDVAKQYGLASSGEPLPPEANDDEPIGDPAGAFMATASDMSRYMLAHLQQGRYDDYEMLSPTSETLMQAPAFVRVPGAPPLGLGFFRNDYNGHPIVAHDGDSSGFHTDMELLFKDGIGFFSCVNSDGVGGLLKAGWLMRSSLFHQFMDRYFPATPALPEPTLATAKEHAQQVAGEYEMSRKPSGTFVRALYLAARVHITANEDGTIETPAFPNFEGVGPQTRREVAPYIWQEVNHKSRLVMEVKDGRVQAWAPDPPGGFIAEPVPFLLTETLNVPLFVAAIIVLLFSVFLWIAAAIVRRRYNRPLDLPGKEKRTRRYAQIAAALGVIYVGAWIVLIVSASGSLAGLHIGLDPWIRLLQFIGLLCAAGAVGAVWNAWTTCRGEQAWWAKAGSVALALAVLNIVWFSFAFSLISAGLNY
jgi:CubicO group peptidase (beta-lactamase class C family)